MLARMWRVGNSRPPLVGGQNGAATLEGSPAGVLRSSAHVYHMIQQLCSLGFVHRSWELMSTQKTCTWMCVAALLFVYFTSRTPWVTVESFPSIRGLRVEVSSSFGEGALVSVNRSCTSCAFLSKSLQDKGFIRKTSGPNSLLIDTLTFVGEIRQL